MTYNGLLRELKRIINENGTRILAVDDARYRVVYQDIGFGMIPYSCCNLVLAATRRIAGYKAGHEWYLPDFELERAARKVAPGKEPADYTRTDVERIILEASSGQLSLQLREYVF